jgi:hypothetical protein
MADDEEMEVEVEEKVQPKVLVSTSFPQLHFNKNTIGSERYISNPHLSKPSKLGRALASIIKKDRANASDETIANMINRSHQALSGARQRYMSTTGSMYDKDCKSNQVLDTYEMLALYLVTGKSVHIDTVGKCLAMISLAKAYEFCSDMLIKYVLDTLKELVTPQNVLSIIIAIGNDAFDNTKNRTSFQVGDEFFIKYAIDNGHEVFADNSVTKDLHNGHLAAWKLVTNYPTIACRLLIQMPAMFWEKTKPPPVAEDEEDE